MAGLEKEHKWRMMGIRPSRVSINNECPFFHREMMGVRVFKFLNDGCPGFQVSLGSQVSLANGLNPQHCSRPPNTEWVGLSR
jgi:hypothetical protein